jgi:DNA-binding response OmpR family regulator
LDERRDTPVETITGPAIAELRHDLRTPINHVLGYSEMLLEECDAVDRPQLEEMCATGKKILESITSALAPSRVSISRKDLERLKQSLQPEVERLEALVAALLRRNRPESQRADLERIRSAAQALRERASGGTVLRTRSAPHAPDDSEAIPAQRGPLSLTGRVLVVDDIETNRDILRRRLEREGCTVGAAVDGRQALALLQELAFDLVLLDIMMPEVDGYEVLARMKADARLRDVPVLMISALDELQSVVRCIEMGAEDYLPKPFDPVLLRARVGACLEKKRLRDQELEYLRNVAVVTQAASALEAGSLDLHTLDAVAARPDALGRLASVFQCMAAEVQAREQRLQQEVRQLRIEIDQGRKAEHVAEITESGYFQHLQRRAAELRQRARQRKE